MRDFAVNFTSIRSFTIDDQKGKREAAGFMLPTIGIKVSVKTEIGLSNIDTGFISIFTMYCTRWTKERDEGERKQN